MSKQKESFWMSYEIERSGYWSPGTLICRFLNDPENFKDYEILEVSTVQITEHRIEILVRQRALT